MHLTKEQKIIFHVDVNSAFLSWSAVKKLREDPTALDLRTVPSVICGDVQTRHGIVTAKSIPAKKYGIRTAEPVMSAIRKCPNLILEKSDFATYREYSHSFMEILRSHSDYVEQASIDEAYVDMTEAIAERYEAAKGNCSAVTEAFVVGAAGKIKDEIYEKLGFTVNIGISVNKLLAKTASDFEKPDKVHTLWPEEIPDKLWPMDIGDLFGCGGATSARLKSLGITTIGEAAHENLDVLKSCLGEKTGEYIWQSANGLGSDHVHAESEEAKSYSNETTLSHDITAELFDKEAPQVVRELAQSVSRRLTRDGVFAQTIGIMVKTSDFRRLSRQTTLEASTNDEDIIYDCASQLLRRLAFGEGAEVTSDDRVPRESQAAGGALSGDDYRVRKAAPGSLFAAGDGIRLVGVSAAKLDRGEYRQVSIFDFMGEESVEDSPAETANEASTVDDFTDRAKEVLPSGDLSGGDRREEADEKQRRIHEMLLDIRRKYGESSVTTGAELMD